MRRKLIRMSPSASGEIAFAWANSSLAGADRVVLDLHSARDAFLDAIAVKILSALSPAANAKLDAWIKTGVKPNVKIFGS